MLSYTAPRATVQQLLQKHDLPCNENTHVASVLQRIKTCRTAALGYHVYQCDREECRHIKYQYHSCRDPARAHRRQVKGYPHVGENQCGIDLKRKSNL